MNHATRPAVTGAVAALAGLAAGELTAAIVNPSTSPILVVGAQIIDLTPTGVKEWTVAHFGVADKPLLIGCVGLFVVLVAAFAGRLVGAGHRFVGTAVFAALGTMAGIVALLRPNASALDAVPALTTLVGAAGTLLLLNSQPAVISGSVAHERRRLLLSGLVLLVAVAVETTARQVVKLRTMPAAVILPRPREPIPELPHGLDAPGITSFRTSNRDFYRVDTRLALPTVDVDTWRLRIDGRVTRPRSFSFDDIASMDLIERDITLTCVSNDVGGRYVGGARWLGVRLTELLDRAGMRDGSDQILSTDVGGMTISTPLSIATDGRDSMIAIGMNGDPLPREHGFPARLIVPGLYGFIGATKWITRMTLTTYAAQDAYWTKRGWATDAPIKPSCRIDTPRPFQTIRSGDDVTIGGVAWAQDNGGVARVEVSIDDTPWQPAILGPSAGEAYWRQWSMTWKATSGSHTIAARAHAHSGQIQTPKRTTPFPNGSSGIQRLTLMVS